MSKRYSGRSFKDSSIKKKAKLSFKEKRKLNYKMFVNWSLVRFKFYLFYLFDNQIVNHFSTF